MNAPDVSPRDLLLSRFRSVAFAALGADVTMAELQEALLVAVEADTRRREPTSPRPRQQRRLRIAG